MGALARVLPAHSPTHSTTRRKNSTTSVGPENSSIAFLDWLIGPGMSAFLSNRGTNCCFRQFWGLPAVFG